MRSIEDALNAMLDSYHVEIRFSNKSYEDLSKYKTELQEQILAFIVARGKRGPLIKPNGIGEPLRGELHGFTKIKPKHLGLRIIYRPVKERFVIMEIIAIGPRDKEKVYNMAARRIAEFHREMAERKQAADDDEY